MLVQCPSCQKVYSSSENFCSNCGAAPNSSGNSQHVMEFSGSAQTILFPVSTFKFVVMYVATIGLYHIFWCLKCWLYLKEQKNVACIPGVRAWFGIIWFIPLMREIKSVGQMVAPEANFKPNGVGAVYVISWLLGCVSPALNLFGLLTMIPFLAANSYVVKINKAAGNGHLINSRFNSWNYAVFATWAILVLIGFIGGMMTKGSGS
jgi:hypothetical protein